MRKNQLWLATVAMIAALVTFAISMAAASASETTAFTAAEYPAFVSGEPISTTLAFESGLTAKCSEAGFAGEMAEATSELALGGGFSSCTAFGSAEGSIETNGCEFVLQPGAGSGDEFSGSFAVACPTGQKIVVKGGNCEVQIGSQTGLGPVGYDELTATEPEEANAVEVSFEMEAASGFTYTKTLDGASCPLAGTGTKSDGVFGGGMKLKAGNIETFQPIDFGIE